MADTTTTARVRVQVEGAEQLNQLSQAFARIAAGAGASPRTATPGRRGVDSNAERNAQSVGQRLAQGAADAVQGGLRAPFEAVRFGASAATQTVLTVAGPMARLGAAAATAAGPYGLAALGVAIVAVGVPLFNLAVTLKALRLSFRWAEDSADRTLRSVARTKRTFPGAIGDAFGAAQSRTSEKFRVATAVFGDGVDSLQEQITRRFTDVRLGRGIRGDRDIFRRWGITPQAVALVEQARGGERMDITDWLTYFIGRREELDARQAASREGSTEWRRIVNARGVLFDDSLKLFNQRFADIIGTWSRDDLRRLRENLRKSSPLGEVPDAPARARAFVVELKTTQGIFAQLKRGIAGDVQPILTQMMLQLNEWLVSTDMSGRSMGMQLRRLASALAIRSWQTMQALLADVDPESIKYFISTMKGWDPSSVITIIEGGSRAMVELAAFMGQLVKIVKFVFATQEDVIRRLEQQRQGRQRWGRGWLWGREGAAAGEGGGFGRAIGRALGYGGGGGAGPAATGAAPSYGEAPPGAPPSGAGSVAAGAGPQRVNYFQRLGAAPLRPGQAATIETPYGRVAAHPQAASDASGFFAELHAQGAPIRKLGSYNLRRKRWGGGWSSHAYAAAWDLDDEQFLSPQMNAWVRANPEKFRGAMEKWNMAQPLPGKDPAHIEWTGPKPVASGESRGIPQGMGVPSGVPPEVGAGGADLTPRGTVSKTALKGKMQSLVAKAGLVGFVPRDAARYGITTGAAHEWAQMFTDLAGKESSWNPNLSNVTAAERRISAGAGSHGLFQLSPKDATNYGLQNTPFTMAQLKDPDVNAWAAVQIAAARMKQSGTIGGAGMGAYWGPIKRGVFRPSRSLGPVGTEEQALALQAPPMEGPGAAPPPPAPRALPQIAPQGRGSVREMQQQVAGIRRLPLPAGVRSYLEYAAAQTGLRVDVMSGGQAPIGTRGPRTGSTRHDVSGAGAADIKLFDPQTNRYLDMRDPADAQKMAMFTAHSVSAGATGVGAGLRYMGANTIHIGGGTRATWGGAPWISAAAEAGRRMPVTAPPPPAPEPSPPVTVAAKEEGPAGKVLEFKRRRLLSTFARMRAEREALERDQAEGEPDVSTQATDEADKARDLLKTREAEKKQERESLTEKPPTRKPLEEGKAAGEAAAKSFKEGIKDVKIPVKAPKEEEQERDKKREDEEQKEAA